MSIRSYLIICLWVFTQACQLTPRGEEGPVYRLYKKITIPPAFVQHQDTLAFGGDIRVGDLLNNGEAAFVVYQAANSVPGGATQPCFLGAFNLAGEVLWQKGRRGRQPNRPGPVAIHDIDADGESEVICLFAPDTEAVKPFSMKNVALMILNGTDGTVEKSARPDELLKATGKGPNWVHQRILIANLRGLPTPRDFIIKLGKTIYAFDDQLQLLWTYFNPNDQYQNCPAYIPAVGDINNDGQDEINGGYYLLDQDGKVLWEKRLGKNMDSVAIDYWGSDTIRRAFCSGFGFVMDHRGDTLLVLGEDQIPHGQELRVGDFDPNLPGREMMIRYNGHRTGVKLIAQSGEVIRNFDVDESPNNTGMEVVYWNGPGQPAMLYNGGALWTGEGKLLCHFPALKNPPAGHQRQGWYHCIPADLTGDRGEEVILYNPWERHLFIYTANRRGWKKPVYFKPADRQYNTRLMD